MHFDHTEPVRDPRLFVGHSPLIDSLRQSSESFLLLGDGRIGKSSLLLHIKRELSTPGNGSLLRVPIYCNLLNPRFSSGMAFFSHVLQSFLRSRQASQLAPPSASLLSQSAASDAEEFLRALYVLEENGLRSEILLLIDNIDQPALFMHDRQRFYQELRKVQIFSHDGGLGVHVLASARPQFLETESALSSRLTERLRNYPLAAFSIAETETLLSLSPDLNQSPDAPALKRFLYFETGGHPCLLQEILAESLNPTRDPTSPIADRIQATCNRLAASGASFYWRYTRSLEPIDFLNLHTLSHSEVTSGDSISPGALAKFSMAGLLRLSDTAALEHTCRNFFRWMRANLPRLMPATRNAVENHEDLFSFLKQSLATVLRTRRILTEKDLQNVILGLLSGANIEFQPEYPILYRSKRYRADVLLPQFSLALEVKLLRTPGDVGRIQDEIAADISPYLSHCSQVLFLLYDQTASSAIGKLVFTEHNPQVHFLHLQAPQGD